MGLEKFYLLGFARHASQKIPIKIKFRDVCFNS
jgi:hypothetical protein